MNWDHTVPKMGDIVRVHLGMIYHYGIYVSDEEVIQFGYPPLYGRAEKAEEVRVITTDIDSFRCGNFPERAKLTLFEKLRRNSPEKTVSIARSCLGEGGYDLVTNNCEHFVRQCVFRKKEVLSQEAGFFTKVYYARIPRNMEPGFTGCPWRDEEIAGCTNRDVKLEKQYSYLLAEHALQDVFGMNGSELGLKKLPSGKIVLDGYYFSISHARGAVATAVSNLPVGVDLEQEERLLHKETEKLAQHILTGKERQRYDSLPEETRRKYLLTCWTQKECLFKASSEMVFRPSAWDVTDIQELKSMGISFDEEKYLLSVYGKGEISFQEVNQW